MHWKKKKKKRGENRGRDNVVTSDKRAIKSRRGVCNVKSRREVFNVQSRREVFNVH